MESYGELLRKTREEKNVSLEEIERATAITKNYILALEEERSDDFPGESYFVGFLTNYCEFLGINAEEVLHLYHAKKIQEAPVPVELTRKHKPKFVLPLLIGGACALVVGVGIYLYFKVFNVPEKIQAKVQQTTEKEKIHQYQFTGKSETKRFYKGDQILFPTKQGTGSIVVTVGETKGTLALLMPSGTQIVELSEERDLDVDGDGFADVIVYLSDISSDEGSHGAEVRLIEKKMDNTFVELSENDSGTELSDIPSAASVKNNSKRVVIHEDTRAYPFTINVTFRGSCLFRYKSDRNTYVEDYFKSGDQVAVNSNNGTRLWMSNNNALKIRVLAGLSSYDLEVGRAGEVKAEDIKWVRDSDGKYRLVLIELD